MKTIKYIFSTILLLAVAWSCTKVEDNVDFVSTAKAPANITASYNITQDNSGLVTITPNGEGAISFDVTFGDDTSEPANLKNGESIDHTYAEGNYKVKIAGYGATKLRTEVTQDLVVSFKAPENLVVTIENDQAISKKVNVTANADYATMFDVYFGETADETPVSANIGETASFVYQEAGTYTIRVVAKGGAIATTEYSEDFDVTAIMQPVASAPAPSTRADADVISIFSSAYTDMAGTNYFPDWGQAGQGSSWAEFDLNGDKMLQYINLSYQGISFGETVDVSAMEYLHLDVWTADVTDLETSLINGVDGNSTENAVSMPLTADEWTSLDIPISAWTDQGLSVDQIFQLKFVGVPWAAGTVFIDNIYFWRAPSVPVKLPLTFDNDGETFTPFLDAEFALSVDPEDANNPVGMITNHGQGWGWEGVSLALDENVNFSVNNTVTMDFYTSDLPHKVLMKFEDTTSPLDNNGNPTVKEEVEVPVTATGWSTLSFQFSTDVDYNQIVIFVDGGVYDITGVYYIDNIKQVGASNPLVGTWKMAPEAGALAVGPSVGDYSWWSNSADDVNTRACFFDDEYVFNADGSFSNVLGASTWLEPWQGVDPESCGTPIAPHDGSNPATWSSTDNTITISGLGAYLGLAKVHNTGEDGTPVNNTITYNYVLSADGNSLELSIAIPGGAWYFKMVK
jgi:hypothetical protein